MFELRTEIDFPAGHCLVGYAGDCARPHGHNWKLEILIRSRKLDRVGIAVDFKVIKAAAREFVSRWDHQNLNDLPEFKELNPTAENMARLAYEKLSTLINVPAGRVGKKNFETWVEKIIVWENERSYACYFEEEA